jgi:hypothetical protein
MSGPAITKLVLQVSAAEQSMHITQKHYIHVGIDTTVFVKYYEAKEVGPFGGADVIV